MTTHTRIVSIVASAALFAGCAQQQQHGKYTPAPAASAPPPAATQPAKAGTVTGYFPSGKAEGSGLLIEKSAPAEVLVGQPYAYTYKVSNLTDATLENVMVMDRVSNDFTVTDSTPKAATSSGGVATWNLGTLNPKESKMISVNGSSPEEGVVTTCGWATYNPIACQEIHVMKANIQLTKTEPSDVIICDSIPTVLTVKNTGSSPLSGVVISDELPAGLTSDGKHALSFDVGNLAPGESKEYKYAASATATGKLVNNAKVTSAQGVSAEASAATTVHKPVLAITCDAMDQQFMGRKFDVCYKVSNTGDAAAAGTVLEVAVPTGVEVVSAGSGQVAGGKITYNLGSIEPAGSQKLCATFTSAASGVYEFAGSAKGSCAAQVSTACSTKIVGVAAILLEKSDHPDPVAIGDTTTYTVKITNQGSAEDHNIQMVVTIAPELIPVSSADGAISGQTVTFPTVPTLAPKQSVTYQVVAKGVKAGDGHTSFKLSSEVLKSPITAEESTHVY